MGGSSGGGSSGKIEYPPHVSQAHQALLNSSMLHMNEVAIDNPYLMATSYDPTATSHTMAELIENYVHNVKVLNPQDSWSIWENKVSDTFERFKDKIDFEAMAEKDREQAIRDFDTDVMPKFRAGMRDVGLVQTSSYKIGEALMYSKLLSEVSQLAPNLREKFLVNLWAEAPRIMQAMTVVDLQYLDAFKNVMHYQLETLRMSYTMNKEFTDVKQEYTVLSKTWALDMHRYVMDALACVAGAGGATQTAGRSVSKGQSAVGGALSGAASGAMMGSVIPGLGTTAGAAIGGVVGLVGGLMG